MSDNIKTKLETLVEVYIWVCIAVGSFTITGWALDTLFP